MNIIKCSKYDTEYKLYGERKERYIVRLKINSDYNINISPVIKQSLNHVIIKRNKNMVNLVNIINIIRIILYHFW